MKKRILLTALLLPSLMFTFPANATDVVVNTGTVYDGGNIPVLELGEGQSAIVKDSVSFLNINITNPNRAAVYNYHGTLEINKATFTNNSSEFGAIYNLGELNIKNSTFTNNSGASYGAYAGTIYGSDYSNGTITIDGSTFTSNINNGYLGAGCVYFSSSSSAIIHSVTNSIFTGNKAHSVYFENYANEGYIGTGGALGLGYGQLVVKNSQFIENSADEGGAIMAWGISDGESSIDNRYLTIMDSLFTKNSAEYGGAISNYAIANISGSEFIQNTSSMGGAIYNHASHDSITSINNSIFEGNKAEHGGAIYTISDMLVSDVNFINNSATNYGGAIYAESNIDIYAQGRDVVFQGNTAPEGGDIYMATSGSNLNINVASDKTVSFGSGISGKAYNININPVTTFIMRSATTSEPMGKVVVNSAIENAMINVSRGEFHLAEGSSLVNSALKMETGTTLNTINGTIDTFGDNIVLKDNVALAVDVNLSGQVADNFEKVEQQGLVTIEKINPIGDTISDIVNINIADLLGLDSSKVLVSGTLQQETQKVLTPIRYLTGSIDERGNISFVPSGNGYKDFNPAVMTSSVAAQLGGLFTQYNSYNQAFMNMDMRMQMNRQEREALRLKNSIASIDTSTPIVYSPIFQPDKNKGAWMRGYSTFESVNMDGGPKVNNVMYGTFFGGDSDMQQLENGGEIQYSVYAGYNGSHQTYSGNSMWQNGGTMGVTGAYYKENFFTALTANVGASVVDASTIFGKEDFPMLIAGIASKTGYNTELADGKFIIQPNYLMSYSFVNTFDYTNASGVRIESDPLHSIQIAPGIKFIGNLKNGWQPYASVRMVWNLMDKTDFTAANTSLPELSIKPWVEYGVGVQKRWGERFTGFAQTMLRSGGRNGVSLGLGFRWAIGKAPEKNPNARNFTPELPKTKVSVAKFIKSSSPQPACHTHVCQPVFASNKTVR